MAVLGAIVCLLAACRQQHSARTPVARTGDGESADTQPITASASLRRLLGDEADQNDDEPSLDEIRFRDLFKQHCAKCHKEVIRPTVLTAKRWREFLPRHARKTHVAAPGAEAILDWYVAHSRDHP